MALNLLEAYGVVPQTVFPESTHSSFSGPLNKLLQTKLREHALVLRALHASLAASSLSASEQLATLRTKKEDLVREVYTIMSATLGAPFTWDYYDADGKAHSYTGTPRAFYAAHTPRATLHRRQAQERVGRVARAVRQHGDRGTQGGGARESSTSARGIMDTALYPPSSYQNTFGVELGLTKAQRLQMGESAMTHAMVLAAVHVEDGKTVRWNVENSWGKGSGEKGWFVMSDAWFDDRATCARKWRGCVWGNARLYAHMDGRVPM
ncbi:cysteine proteinase [Athelia psychrophila]|uniref:Cysteine proteinase n=1 Tax=Athelia psychrophila TaxID=1759441 RepID=A0A166LHR2_9AGAM|nr:cysteine proteinase [Fibularhizoctonia sp. CBS 109695]